MSPSLQSLDLLFWQVSPEASLIQRAIGWAERLTRQANADKVNYFHVGFVAQDATRFYQSKPPRICLSDVPDPLPDYMEVFRLIKPPTPDQVKQICAYADTRLGQLYDFLGVLTMGWVEVGGLEFCSDYVNDCFSYGDIVLIPHHLLMSPDDLAASPLLRKI